MAFTATKREVGEIYTFFRLLADGFVTTGTAQATASDVQWPIAMLQREEHDGTRRYVLDGEEIHVIKGKVDKKGIFTADGEETHLLRADFEGAAQLLLGLLKSGSGEDIEIPDELKRRH